jgi:hypothetical protein
MVRTRSKVVESVDSGPSSAPILVPAPARKKQEAAKKTTRVPKEAAKVTTVVERTLGISATNLCHLIDAQRRIYEDQGWVDLSEEVCKGISRGRLNYLVLKHTMPV